VELKLGHLPNRRSPEKFKRLKRRLKMAKQLKMDLYRRLGDQQSIMLAEIV